MACIDRAKDYATSNKIMKTNYFLTMLNSNQPKRKHAWQICACFRSLLSSRQPEGNNTGFHKAFFKGRKFIEVGFCVMPCPVSLSVSQTY